MPAPPPRRPKPAVAKSRPTHAKQQQQAHRDETTSISDAKDINKAREEEPVARSDTSPEVHKGSPSSEIASSALQNDDPDFEQAIPWTRTSRRRRHSGKTINEELGLAKDGVLGKGDDSPHAVPEVDEHKKRRRDEAKRKLEANEKGDSGRRRSSRRRTTATEEDDEEAADSEALAGQPSTVVAATKTKKSISVKKEAEADESLKSRAKSKLPLPYDDEEEEEEEDKDKDAIERKDAKSTAKNEASTPTRGGSEMKQGSLLNMGITPKRRSRSTSSGGSTTTSTSPSTSTSKSKPKPKPTSASTSKKKASRRRKSAGDEENEEEEEEESKHDAVGDLKRQRVIEWESEGGGTRALPFKVVTVLNDDELRVINERKMQKEQEKAKAEEEEVGFAVVKEEIEEKRRTMVAWSEFLTLWRGQAAFVWSLLPTAVFRGPVRMNITLGL